MAPVSRKYDEPTLCPMALRTTWWYTQTSQRRKRIRDAIASQGMGDPARDPMLIGQIQDAIIGAGQARLASMFMESMQVAYDAEQKRLAAEQALLDAEDRPPKAVEEWAAAAESFGTPEAFPGRDVPVGLNE